MITELQINSKTDKELAEVMKLAANKYNIKIEEAIWDRKEVRLYMLVSGSVDLNNMDMCDEISDYIIGLKNRKLEEVATVQDIAISDTCPMVDSEDITFADARKWYDDGVECYIENEIEHVIIVKGGVWQEV